MNHDNERKAFEAWFESRYDAHFMQFALDLDLYVDKHTQTCWEAWLSSANREGYKLVPIKCTNNMAHAAKEIDGRLSAFKYGDVWEAMIGACDDH